MNNTDPERSLENIVVEISRDGKTCSGTGFFISPDEIATCYHVLVPPEGGKLKKIYRIKHDNWVGWQKATLVRAQPLPDDVAVLKTSKKLESFDIKLQAWNKRSCEFVSRGYSEETSEAGFGANEIDGRIITDTKLEKRTRLQLQTSPDAIKGGRSGSPVFSLDQNAIVGMIDYQGGELNRDAQIGAAIPIEAIVSLGEVPPEGGRIMNIPELPANFLQDGV